MKSLVKSLSLVSLLIMFLSCEVLSPILTKNYFEEFKDLNPLADILPEQVWGEFSEAEQQEKLNEYIDAVIYDEKNAKDLYEQLKDSPQYKRDMADALMGRFDDPTDTGYLTVPVYGSETFADDLKKYQQTAIALAKIEVYGSQEMAITGFENIIVDFATGEQTNGLSNETLMDYLFDLEGETSENRTEDIRSLYNAGIAVSYLGSTIIDRDNPTSEFVTDDDAILILISAMINTIITDSVANFSDNNSAVITALVTGIETGTFDSNLNFPQDKVDNNDPIVQYLGEDGAVVYAATGYELPDAELVMGGNE